MILSAMFALALAAAPDAGHAHADHAPAPAAQPAKAKTKRVCQTVASSNTRMPKKVCTTVKVEEAPASAPPAQADAVKPD